MDNPYLEVISYVERIHRQFLEVVKLELEGFGIHDINNVQAMMLFNIGDAEMTVGELTLRGCYLGSNVSYNVRKMVENEYLAHERSVHDRRSIHVRLTEKGIKLRDSLTTMHRRQAEMLSRPSASPRRIMPRSLSRDAEPIGQRRPPGRKIANHCSVAETDKRAKRYEHLTHQAALAQGLKVMDATAFALAQENRMPIIVFSIRDQRAIEAVLRGKGHGTTVAS
jgi:DNA-binding MarR family transcriptional regulator